jgi:hypothetical protein
LQFRLKTDIGNLPAVSEHPASAIVSPQHSCAAGATQPAFTPTPGKGGAADFENAGDMLLVFALIKHFGHVQAAQHPASACAQISRRLRAAVMPGDVRL